MSGASSPPGFGPQGLDAIYHRRSRGDGPEHIFLKEGVGRETTLPLKWLAARVRSGTSQSAHRNRHRWRKPDRSVGML